MRRLALYDFLFEEDRTKALKKRVYEAPDVSDEDAVVDECRCEGFDASRGGVGSVL